MPEFLADLLSSDGFTPHGHGFPWRPPLVGRHVLSDAVAHDVRAPLRATSGDRATLREHHSSLDAAGHDCLARILRRPGGRGWAEATEARGATVHFTLPPGAGSPPPTRPHTMILLVEDNPDDEILTLRALKKHHVSNDVVVARTGEDALDFLFGTGPHAGRDLAVRPQVVLLDLNLPKLDGLGVLRQIRADQRTRLQPVVVLTSSKEDEDILRSYALGANSYVRKPVGFAEFSDAVRTLGLFWMLTNEMPPQLR